MVVDDDYDEISESASPNSIEIMSGQAAWKFLTRVELDMAYSSEKALNLELFLMQVEDIASDYAALILENEDLSTEKVGKAFEFDILSAILCSEVKELNDFVSSLQLSIVDAGSVHFEELSLEIKGKLQDADKSLKKTQHVVADIRKRSAKFESDLAFVWYGTHTDSDLEIEGGRNSPTNAKWKQQKEQQRHFLQLLEKSLARELDLEKKLSESRHNEEDLKLKLLYAEQEIYNSQESLEIISQRKFEAENAAEALIGISKVLSGKLQIVQFNLKGTVLLENEVRSKLEESMKSGFKASVQKTEDECDSNISEAYSLKDKVRELEEQLRESDTSREQWNILNIEIKGMENIIEGFKEDISRLEIRTESTEEKCAFLTRTNTELNEQLSLLSNNGTEKANSLERKLKESDTQLDHAKSSVEAIEEQQNLLYSALSDMENLISDLKGKVSKAESRAENVESKCTLLTETNLELDEELGFLRNRLECAEASLNQADDAKIVAAKDIGIRTKFITDLVMKLALEREHLQLQISMLAKQNKMLTKNCLKTKDDASNNTGHKEAESGNNLSILESPEVALTGSAATNIQVDESFAAMCGSEASVETTVLTENSSDTASKLEAVRTFEAAQLSLKYLFLVVFVLLVSIAAIYLFQLEN